MSVLKKFIVFLFMSTLVLFNKNILTAQTSPNLKFGSVFVYRDISDTEADTFGMMDGWHIGLDARISPYGYYLSPGLHLYWFQVKEGTNFLSVGDPRYFNLKIPLNMGYCVNMNRKFSVRFSVGGNINYVFHVDKNDVGIDFTTINDLFLGVNAGGGFDYGRFTFDVVYENGLTPVVKIPDKRRFNFWSVTIGRLF